MGFNQVGLGARIKFIRKNLGMTQAVLAEKANLSIPYISHIECGKKNVSLQALIGIAAALDVSLDFLVTGSQTLDSKALLPEAEILLNSCTLRERQILLDVAVAAKRSLRNNP
jgi:transcriptional regulator with XRE-family HTH domain